MIREHLEYLRRLLLLRRLPPRIEETAGGLANALLLTDGTYLYLTDNSPLLLAG
jgi:hypothetical protein